MKFVVIAAVVLSFIALVGCAQTASLGSASRAPDTRVPKRFPPDVQDCMRVPFPQCSGA